MLIKSGPRQMLAMLAVAQVASFSLPVWSAGPQTNIGSFPGQSALSTAQQLPISSRQVPLTANAAPANDLGMSLPGTEWALPVEGKLDANGKPRQAPVPLLTGTITSYDVDNDFGQLVDALLESALYQSTKMEHLDKSLAHYRKPMQTALKNARDGANWVIPYRGFAPSSEAADVILDEKIKVKDKASAAYARQRYIDDMHPQVVAKTLQLAMALGTPDSGRRDELVQQAVKSLAGLVGQQKAELALQKLQGWSKDVQVPDALYQTAASWDVDFYTNKLQTVTKLGMDGDPVMKEIVRRLQKYNHHNAASRGGSKMIEGGLSLASWIAPGYLVPLAMELVNVGYVLATGGPEESKLIKELYYDKRVESRYRAINQEAQLALAQYQNALNIKNPALLVCCESVLSQLVGSENISDVLGGRTLLTHRLAGQHTIETAQSASQSLQ